MKRKISKGFEEFYKGYEKPVAKESGNILVEKRIYFLIGLGLFTIVFVDLFFWQMHSTLNNPFTKQLERSAMLYPDVHTPSDEEVLLALQDADTDLDGLSDYDEMYLYNTSSFIPDTDSDGISDFDEVQSGGNPICHKDSNCSIEAPSEEDAFAESTSLFDNEASVALREALIVGGIPEEELDSFTNEELMDFYQQSVQSLTTGSSNKDSVNPEQLLYFENLGPDEIRDMLISAGLDPDLIETISDERIKELYLETLDSTLDPIDTLDNQKENSLFE